MNMNMNTNNHNNDKHLFRIRLGFLSTIFISLFVIGSFVIFSLTIHPSYEIKIANRWGPSPQQQYIAFSNKSIEKIIVSNIHIHSSINTTSSNSVMKEEIISNDSEINIFMDWLYRGKEFGYFNYKSLETILTYYPNAKIKILIFGPTTLKHYRLGDSISYMQFQKYKKRGYDIEVVIIPSDKTYPLKAISENLSMSSKIQIPSSSISDCFDKDRYDHEYYYLFPGCLWYLNRYDSYGDKFTLPKYKQANSQDLFIQADVLFLNYLRLFFLYAEGGLYIDFNSFLSNSLSLSEKTIDKGYYSFRPTEDEDDDFNRSSNNSDQEDGQYILYFPHAKDPLLKCVLSTFDEKSNDFNDDNDNSNDNFIFNSNFRMQSCITNSINNAKIVSQCIRLAFEKCDVNFKYQKDFVAWTTSSSIEQSNELLSRNNSNSNSNSNSKPIIALLKPKVYDNSYNNYDLWWKIPEENSFFHSFLKKNINLTKWNDIQRKKECHITCPHLTHIISNDTRSKFICAPSFVIPGFAKAATSSIFDSIVQHPQILQPLTGSNFKETGAYLSLSVDRPVTGYNNRLNSFPFMGMENGDHQGNNDESNFITGDGTVYYMRDFESQKRLYLDNPNIKAIIALRNPLDRAFSQYRLEYDTRSRLNVHQIIQRSIILMKNCYHFVEFLDFKNKKVNQSILLDTANNIFNCLGGKGELDHSLEFRLHAQPFLESLYLPQLMHWVGLFGYDSFFIVEREDFTKNFSTIMKEMTFFLGLCSYNGYLQQKINTSRRKIIDDTDRRMTLTDKENLWNIYEKWNTKLYDFLGKEFKWKNVNSTQ